MTKMMIIRESKKHDSTIFKIFLCFIRSFFFSRMHQMVTKNGCAFGEKIWISGCRHWYEVSFSLDIEKKCSCDRKMRNKKNHVNYGLWPE